MNCYLPPKTMRTPAKGQRSVLVIDDNYLVRDVLTRLLKRLGFEVYNAADGQGGLALLRAGIPNLSCILVDQIMPNMSGAEVVHALQDLGVCIPIMFMSGFDMDTGLGQIDGDPIAFLVKPFSLIDLQARLQELLGLEEIVFCR